MFKWLTRRGDRYEVTEVQWDANRKPFAWAIWDKTLEAYVGRIWYKSKRTANETVKLLNKERV